MVSEQVVESALPTPRWAITRSEAPLASATLGRIRTLVERVEKCIENRGTSKLAKQRADAFDPHPTPVFESTYSEFPARLPLAGPHTPPAFYSLTPARQADVDRRMRAEVERIAAMQA